MTTSDCADVEEDRIEESAPASDTEASTDATRVTFDSNTRTVTEAVVTAVANARGCDPLDVPPLYHSIDPDALDSFFDPTNGRHQLIDATIEFEYVGHTVTVNGYGAVEARTSSLPTTSP